MGGTGMKYFQPAEFEGFDHMNAELLALLDDVRERCGVALRITSAFRTPAANTAASGSSPTSLHMLGRAVDFVPAVWDRETLWKVVEAVILCKKDATSVELELTQGDADKHVHLGLFPDKRPSRLVLTID